MRKPFYVLATSSMLVVLVNACAESTKSCFMYSQSQNPGAHEIQFDATCSSQAYAYKWNLGVGAQDTITEQPKFSYTYPAPGHYAVSLRILPKDGLKVGKGKAVDEQVVVVK